MRTTELDAGGGGGAGFRGIIDSTLREGAQVPEAVWSPRRRLALVRGLAEVGIEEAEIGVAARDTDLRQRVRAARRAAPGLRLAVWCRCLPDDVKLAAESGADVLAISLPASDVHLAKRLGKTRAWALEQVARAAELARSAGGRFLALGLEDATRADLSHLHALWRAARDAGWNRVRLADTVGVATPSRMAELVRACRETFGGAVGVHAHDDFALATANAVAAIEAGAAWVDGTLLGIGERAGNARTEVLAAFLAAGPGGFPGRYRLEPLAGLCRTAARACRRSVPESAPVVGRAIWRCASGLHVDGLLKDARTYQPYDPRLVGAEQEVLLGSGSGTGAVRALCRQLGHPVEAAELPHVVREIRRSRRSLDAAAVRQLLRRRGAPSHGGVVTSRS
jgi:homocitrate synthase NifV